MFAAVEHLFNRATQTIRPNTSSIFPLLFPAEDDSQALPVPPTATAAAAAAAAATTTTTTAAAGGGASPPTPGVVPVPGHEQVTNPIGAPERQPSEISVNESRRPHIHPLSSVHPVNVDAGGAEYAIVRREDPEAWTGAIGEHSLPEAFGTIEVKGETSWRRFMSFVGPGIMIAVGYMDPGNWSTDIAGGSAFGYDLLFIVLLSSLMAIFLQSLSVRLGLSTNRDLAQACRDTYPKPLVYFLWITAELAILATDLAEVIGSAIALNLLTGLPLIGGVVLTALDVLVILFTQGRSFRIVEGFVATLVLLITVCFAVQIGMSHPGAAAVMFGFLPTGQLFSNTSELLIAVGIIGATVMPHNLILHSSLVLTRQVPRDDPVKIQQAIRYATLDSTVSLLIALFVNAAILVVAAATYNVSGYTDVATLADAYHLLGPILGDSSKYLFAVALLASGQNSTLTGTMAGQIVMEGFVKMSIKPVYRRFFTRLLAIMPAIIAIAVGGNKSANYLLLLSQVVLSICLPFMIFPLVHITSNKRKMLNFVNSRWTTGLGYVIATFILVLNFWLFSQPGQLPSQINDDGGAITNITPNNVTSTSG